MDHDHEEDERLSGDTENKENIEHVVVDPLRFVSVDVHVFAFHFLFKVVVYVTHGVQLPNVTSPLPLDTSTLDRVLGACRALARRSPNLPLLRELLAKVLWVLYPAGPRRPSCPPSPGPHLDPVPECGV